MDCRAFSYWTLKWLRSLQAQGVFFLMRDIAGIVLWLDGTRLDLLAVLRQLCRGSAWTCW